MKNKNYSCKFKTTTFISQKKTTKTKKQRSEGESILCALHSTKEKCDTNFSSWKLLKRHTHHTLQCFRFAWKGVGMRYMAWDRHWMKWQNFRILKTKDSKQKIKTEKSSTAKVYNCIWKIRVRAQIGSDYLESLVIDRISHGHHTTAAATSHTQHPNIFLRTKRQNVRFSNARDRFVRHIERLISI